MQVIKALIGGLVGGCLGAYVVNLIGPVRGAMGPWLILLAGLGAGLGARLLCGANRSFVTGIVSAIAAIVGVVLVSYSTAAVALRSSDEMESPLEVARSVEESIDEIVAEEEVEPAAEDVDPSETTDAELTIEVVEDATFVPPTKAPYELPDKTLTENVLDSMNAKQGSMDIIANAVSALLAFVIGTGSTKRDPEESQPKSSETA